MAEFEGGITEGFNAFGNGIEMLSRLAAKQASETIDNRFAEYAQINQITDYKKENYHRIGFSEKQSAEAFVSDMKARGIDVLFTTSKVSDQFLVEIPKENNIDGTIVDANTLVSEFNASGMGYADKEVNSPYVEPSVNEMNTYQRADYTSRQTSAATGFILGNLDYLGKAISGTGKVLDKIEDYGVKYDVIDTNKGSANYNPFDTEYAHSSVSKTATVINNDIVVIDGKVVTDEKIRNAVLGKKEDLLQRANAVIEKTDKIIGKSDKNKEDGLQETKLSKSQAKLREQAQSYIDNIYNEQEFVSSVMKEPTGLAHRSTEFDKMIAEISTDRINAVASLTAEEASFLAKSSADGVNQAVLDQHSRKEVTNLHYVDVNALREDINAIVAVKTVGRREAFRELQKIRDEMGGDVKLSDLVSGKVQNNKIGRDKNGEFFLKSKKNLDKREAFKELQKIRDEMGGNVKLSDLWSGKVKNDKILRDENGNFYKYTDDEHKTAQSIQKKLDESLKDSYEVALKKDLGITLMGNLTQKDVLKANEAFLEKAASIKELPVLVKKNGNLDLDKVRSLKGLRYFNDKTIDFIIETNRQDWSKMGKADFLDFQSAGMFVGRKFLKAVGKTGDEDANALINGAEKTARYAQKTVTSVRQFNQTFLANKTSKSLKNEKKIKSTMDNLKKQKPAKKLDTVNTAKLNEKHKKLGEKAVKRMARNQNSLLAKGKALYNKVTRAMVQKLASTKVGAAAIKVAGVKTAIGAAIAPAIPWILLILLIMVGVEIALIVVIAIVESIASFISGIIGDILPSYFTESIGYNVIVELQGLEDEWVQKISSPEKLYESRKDLEFGGSISSSERNFNGYVSKIGDIVLSGDTIYVCPFYKTDSDGNITRLASASGANKDILTQQNGFTGTVNVSFSANVSDTGSKGIIESRLLTGESGTLSIESGHTSNIKDILSMIDVMYSMDLSNSDDDTLKIDLGTPAFQADWETFWKNVQSIFENIGKFFSNLGNLNNVDWSSINGSPYQSVRSYAQQLFILSHNQELNLHVEYYDVGTPMLNVNGTMTEWTDAKNNQNLASAMGKCTSPVTHKFKIAWDKSNNKIRPILTGEDGSMYYLDNDEFAVNISMANLDSSDVCLWNYMGSNEATYNTIKTNTCWTLSSSLPTSHTQPYSMTRNTENLARQAVLDATTVARATVAVNNEYSLNTDRNQMIAHYYTVATDTPSITVTANTHMEDDTSKVKDFTDNNGNGKYDAGEDYTDANGNGKYDTGETYTDSNSNGVYDAGDTIISYEQKEVTDSYTATATANIYSETTETWTRNCQGHNFKYCGGHICATSQGIVLSMTNEQLGLSGAYNNVAESPLADGLQEHYEHGEYDELLGKYDKSTMDYTTLQNLQKSPSSHWISPTTNPQGTNMINYAAGMNILLNRGSITGGHEFVASGIQYHFFQDLFDVDLILMKGNNVLPTLTAETYQQYEGWIADNMSLAAMRTTVDWQSVYGIDTPIELGALPISTTEDTEVIIEALKETYGDKFTEEREAIIREALIWVGRAHYNDDETHNHAFLSTPCVGQSYGYTIEGSTEEYSFETAKSCTAGDSEDFLRYVLYKAIPDDFTQDDALDYTENLKKKLNETTFSSTSDILPADIIYHKGTDLSSVRLPELPSISKNAKYVTRNKDNSGISENYGLDIANDVLKAYTKDSYCLYIGTINKDIYLSNGVKICAGNPITIDFRKINGIGTIRLNTVASDSIYKIGISNIGNETYGTDSTDTHEVLSYSYYNPYWVTNPDSFTSVCKIAS